LTDLRTLRFSRAVRLHTTIQTSIASFVKIQIKSWLTRFRSGNVKAQPTVDRRQQVATLLKSINRVLVFDGVAALV
jgi:hypothetical protein